MSSDIKQQQSTKFLKCAHMQIVVFAALSFSSNMGETLTVISCGTV